MFVKQITLEEALRLAANGNEVMTLVPGEEKSDWREMIPDTLQNMLSGVMFFRREPALEKPMIDSEEDPPPQPRTDEAVVGGKGKKKKANRHWENACLAKSRVEHEEDWR